MNPASEMATALDPARLMIASGMEPDDWQRRVLRSGWERALLLCSRQAGKSSVTAALGLHRALYHEGSLVLLVAPSLRQSRELFSKVWGFYRAAGMPGTVEKKSSLRATFGNGSRIIALPGKEGTIRGFSGVDLLVIDEAARVEDELYNALRPMLAVSGGRLVGLTTPAGKRGWFYEAFTSEEDWHRERIPAEECPRITESFLEEERRELGRYFYEQEYECQFHDAEGSLFKRAEIDEAFTSDVKPLFEEEASAQPDDESIQPLDL
jgi:phage terminase large subunit-like protein